jgi:hypothetical protein
MIDEILLIILFPLLDGFFLTDPTLFEERIPDIHYGTSWVEL